MVIVLISKSRICVNNSYQKKTIFRNDHLTNDTSSSGQKDLVFVKSSADNSIRYTPDGEKPCLSEAEGLILPNHDTDRILSVESQRNTSDPSVAITDSLVNDYDSTNESSVCSTPLPPLEKLPGAEPVSRPKTIKSFLKSNCTFKANALKVSLLLNHPQLLLRCERTDHITCDHAEFMSSTKINQHLTGQGESTSRSRPSWQEYPFLLAYTMAGSETRPHMLNKENYVPWSRLLRYAKSRPNGKLIYNSIINGPYVRRMIREPEADDQAIQTILCSLPKEIYAAVDSCETAQEIYRHVTIVHQTKDLHIADYTQLYDFLKYNQNEVDDLRAERLAKTHDPLALMANSNNPFNYLVFHPYRPSSSTYMQQPQPNNNYNPQPSFNQNYMQQSMPNLEDIIDPTTAMNMTLVLMAKAFKLNYSTPTNNNHRISSNPRNRQIAQPGMNMGQDRQIQIVGGNGIQVVQKVVQNLGIQNVGNQNGLIVIPWIANQNPNRNGNVVAARIEGSANGNNGNQIRCYNCRRLGHLTRNYRVRPRKRDAAYLQTQFLIAQKEEAGIQLQAEEFDMVAAIVDLDEIEEVNANYILMANLQQALTSEADESLAKHKALELEIERLLRAVVSHDIMSIVQNPSVVDTSDLQTELDRMKERFENCIIKKENEYAKIWNDWYQKCEECKYDKLSYDKAYNDMQQKIKQLQAQLGDQKGKSNDTPCVSDTLDHLSQKLENKNMELEFQILNYAKENAYLKTIYKNLFNSIFVSEQKDTTKGTSANTKFANQSNLGKPFVQPLRNHFVVQKPNAFQTERPKRVPPKVAESNDLLTSGTSNSVPTTKESKVMENDKVISPGMFRIDPRKTYKEDKFVPINKVRASVRTNPINVSQPNVITKEHVNSDSNGLSSTGVDNTAKTRRPQPRSNTNNNRVLSASLSSCIKNKEVEVEEHHRNLLLSKNKKHMSSECKNIKLSIWNDKFEVVCAMRKQCLITANHDVCVLNYVNGMNSSSKKQKANVSNTKNQKKQKLTVKKPKKIGSKERLASPTPILLQAPIISVRTDNDIEFKNQVLKENFNSVGISHQTSSVRTPQQIGIMEQRNRTLVEVVRTMLIFSRTPLFLWAEAIATACYTQNRSIIHRRFNKTPYELINGIKPDISFLHVLRALLLSKKMYREIMGNLVQKTMNVTFDEFSAMAFEQSSSKLGIQGMTSGQISSGLDLTYALSTITTQQPTEGELDLLLEAMYDDQIGGQPSAAPRTVSAAQAPQVLHTPTTTTTTADTASTPTNSSSQAINFPNTSEDVDELKTQQHV
ncbi:integrase, catalytic region, zinc finger, CCHC-type containing protein [Tanacetum coccineum]|uniref:Integrase, catalytic region, zinc finger, CCHC-type containing protein n=1 Tax=Tanacetum coccineum TaxID=301880 RepID=A0ABQ4ZKW1_9ASTR